MKTCSTCSHPQRADIDVALIHGTPLRNIARQYGTSLGALHRHKRAHLSSRLVKAQSALEVAQATTLVEQIKDIMADAKVIQKQAEQIAERAQKANDWPAATSALREARSCLSEIRECSELLAEAVGELKRGGGMNVAVAFGGECPTCARRRETAELSDEQLREKRMRLIAFVTAEEQGAGSTITLPIPALAAESNIRPLVETQGQPEIRVSVEPVSGRGDGTGAHYRR
jgi:hypothetical protein